MSDNVNQDPEIEYSSLCRPVTRDGLTVRVAIYRVPELDVRWSLEVIDQMDASTVWDDLFNTDEEAYAAFEKALAEEGIRGLTETFH